MDLLDEAVAKVRKLPAERQQEAAELLLEIAEHDPNEYRLSAEQHAEVSRRLGSPPDYASDAEVAEVFDRLLR